MMEKEFIILIYNIIQVHIIMFNRILDARVIQNEHSTARVFRLFVSVLVWMMECYQSLKIKNNYLSIFCVSLGFLC